MTDLVDGTRSREAVRSMVRAALPDWEVGAVDRVEVAANGVYPVGVTDGRQRVGLVLKVCGSTDAASFRPEPYLLDVVARRTDVPVPSVVAVVDDHDEYPPYFLMERCPGRRLDDHAGDLSAGVRDRIARDAGRYLGQLHLLGSFDRFGPLRVRDAGGSDRPTRREDAAADGGATDDRPAAGDGAAGPPSGAVDREPDPARRPTLDGGVARWSRARSDEDGIEEPDFAVGVAEEGPDRWADWFRALASVQLRAFDDRFADLRSDARAALRAVDLPDADPVFVHNDYRYWNLLGDPETGATTAVLDFENKTTAAARFNLVKTVDRLSDWAPVGSDRRRRVREAVLVGYETATGRRPDLGAAACDAYRLASRLPALAWFDRRHADDPPETRSAAADHHREGLHAAIERCLDG